MAELEEQVRQAQLQQLGSDLGTKKSRKLVTRLLFTFDESHDEIKVLAWLCKIDIQIRKNEKMWGEYIDDDEKLIIVEEISRWYVSMSILSEDPIRWGICRMNAHVTMEMIFERINREQRMDHDTVDKSISNTQ